MFLITIIALAVILLFSRLYFYIAITLVTAFLFCFDKQAAIRGKSRIPEKLLLLFCFLGGAFGALITIFVIRHKSSKPQFFLPVFLAAGIHILLFILFK